MAMKYSWFHHHDCTTEQADTLISDYQKRGVKTEKSLNPVNPAPGDELVKAVRDHILPLAPVAGGGLFVFAATEKSIPVTIALAKDTPEIRTAIIAELNALMLRDGAPSGKIYVSRISEAISLATGEVAHQLRVPAADVVLGKTELPVLGNITWATYTGENG